MECEVCAAEPQLRMTEEGRAEREQLLWGRESEEKSAATIEPREMDSIVRDFSSLLDG